MNANDGKRDFERYALQYTMEVIGHDIEGKPFTEKTVLEDISGGGARFCSLLTDTYHVGQTLEFTITLPETERISASMEGSATVVRIIEQAETGRNKRRISIAVTLDSLMEFGMTEASRQKME